MDVLRLFLRQPLIRRQLAGVRRRLFRLSHQLCHVLSSDAFLETSSVGFRYRRCCVWRAIMSSSLVGITHALGRLSAGLMRGPPRALAAASREMPSHEA